MLWNAHRAGSPLQKLFPAPAGGPDWLRSVPAPMPFLRIIPTNGVDVSNAAAWLAAFARDWDAVEIRARALLTAVLD